MGFGLGCRMRTTESWISVHEMIMATRQKRDAHRGMGQQMSIDVISRVWEGREGEAPKGLVQGE